MQKLADIEKIDSKGKISCSKKTEKNGRRKLRFKTDTDNLIVVQYRYRNKLKLKDSGFDLKLIDYHSHLAKRVYLLRYFDKFFRRCIVLEETTVHKLIKLRHEWMFSFY